MIQSQPQLETSSRLFTVPCKLCCRNKPVLSLKTLFNVVYRSSQGNELCAAVLLEHYGPAAVQAKDRRGQTAVHGESRLINKQLYLLFKNSFHSVFLFWFYHYLPFPLHHSGLRLWIDWHVVASPQLRSWFECTRCSPTNTHNASSQGPCVRPR